MSNLSVHSQIDEAINNLDVLSITYVDKKGKTSVREVEPLEIKDGKLFAWCRNKNSLRGFLMPSVLSATTTGLKFTKTEK